MIRIFLSTALLFIIWTDVHAGAHWKYDGMEGPDNWGRLSREYLLCASGKNQSPIEVLQTIRGVQKAPVFAYSTNTVEVVNTGLGIRIGFADSGYLKLDNQKFDLKQLDIHMPGEHRIKGKSYPMEMELLHSDREGNLAIVSVQVAQGKANPVLEQIIAQLPAKAGKKVSLSGKVTAANLLPKSRGFIRYNGSLTTPPCSEGVRWILLKSPIQASAEQLRVLGSVMKVENARPLQPLNARQVIE